jgi:hypothetical protein
MTMLRRAARGLAFLLRIDMGLAIAMAAALFVFVALR